ncbi:MAG TPA: hypothetical protein PKH04_08930, partial [Burkholderiaceae bacterium]|nr:hypothetical protein [Burkholderiaceae bacterium]
MITQTRIILNNNPRRRSGFPGWGLVMLAVVASWALGGCATRPAEPPVESPPVVVQPVVKKPPRIGLALGGGAARGFAHVGVIQVLEEAGIKVDLV